VGDASVVVVVLSIAAGLVASIGVDSAGLAVSVVVVSAVAAGDGLMAVSVVAASVVSAGDAAGAAVSVFCSHATRSAALAKMQMYFFIGFG
jgi:hypothetical protein